MALSSKSRSHSCIPVWLWAASRVHIPAYRYDWVPDHVHNPAYRYDWVPGYVHNPACRYGCEYQATFSVPISGMAALLFYRISCTYTAFGPICS
jgi:hypothetical protein